MEYPEKKARHAQDFRDFISVRTNFLGLLAVFSAFLPLLNNALQLFPLSEYGVDNGVLGVLTPTVITVIATTIALVAVISIFAMRASYCGFGKRDAQRKALTSLRVCIGAFIFYIMILQIYREYPYLTLSVTSEEFREIFFEAPVVIAYATFFSHLTQSLMLLAMTQFYKKIKCDA
jgi:hypothetical protein